MNDTVIIINAVASAVATFAGIMISNKLTMYRIEQLEKKVEKHNCIVERTYRLEERVNNLRGELK